MTPLAFWLSVFCVSEWGSDSLCFVHVYKHLLLLLATLLTRLLGQSNKSPDTAPSVDGGTLQSHSPPTLEGVLSILGQFHMKLLVITVIPSFFNSPPFLGAPGQKEEAQT